MQSRFIRNHQMLQNYKKRNNFSLNNRETQYRFLIISWLLLHMWIIVHNIRVSSQRLLQGDRGECRGFLILFSFNIFSINKTIIALEHKYKYSCVFISSSFSTYHSFTIKCHRIYKLMKIHINHSIFWLESYYFTSM